MTTYPPKDPFSSELTITPEVSLVPSVAVPSLSPLTNLEKFWDRVFILGEDDCWEWIGCVNSKGYGRVRSQGREYRTHQLAWILTHGDTRNGLCVLHECDNPPCCNPKHLFLGTNADNTTDMVRKGRLVSSPGDAHGRAKLTSRQVLMMRALWNTGEFTRKELAIYFEISHPHAARIVRRGEWRHI